MALTLFDVGVEGAELEALLTELDGELTPDLEARFDAFLAGGKSKLDAAARVLRTLAASEETCKQEAARLSARAQSFAKQSDALRARMLFAVDAGFGGKVKTDTHSFWGQSSASTASFSLAPDADITALATMRPEIVRTTHELNRKALAELYKSGSPLGSEIEVSENPGTRFLRVK